MGDFNSVLNVDDRIGSNQVNTTECLTFILVWKHVVYWNFPNRGIHIHGMISKVMEESFQKLIEWLSIMNGGTKYLLLVHFLLKGISDHCLMKLALLNVPRRARRPFKYCNFGLVTLIFWIR